MAPAVAQDDFVGRILAREIEVDAPPSILWVEPTSVCNLRCVMCPNSILSEKRQGSMDVTLYERIIEQAAVFDPFLALFLGGESLLHPDLMPMIGRAKAAGLSRVHLATNATKLTPAAAELLLDTGLDRLTFSFDGYDAPSYEAARVGAVFEKTVANIRHFLRRKQERGQRAPLTKLYCLDLQGVGPEPFQRFARERFGALGLDEFGVEQPGHWRGLFADTDRFKPKRNGPHYFPCHWLWRALSIGWDGKVLPCCADFDGDLPLGDVREQPILDIWNDEPMRALRRAMLEQRLDPQRHQICLNECDNLYYHEVDERGVPRVLASTQRPTLTLAQPE